MAQTASFAQVCAVAPQPMMAPFIIPCEHGRPCEGLSKLPTRETGLWRYYRWYEFTDAGTGHTKCCSKA